jgi:hypothetical protein
VADTSIGIKIADGTFYPVLSEGAPGRKRVILTTVKDNQTGAQIDLYRGNGTGISGATYIGTLVIDEIEPGPQGNPEIELIVKLDVDGNLEAQASDHITGEHQTLSLVLDSLSTGEIFDIPDFGLDDRYQPDLGVSPAEESRLTSEPVATDFQAVEDDVRRQRRRRLLQYLGIGIVAIVVILIVVLLVLWLTRRPAQPSAAVAASPPAVAAQPVSPPAKAAPKSQTPPVPAPAASSSKAASPAAAAGSAQTVREGGVAYQIRWGDTLWDLSMSFYRTPWLYGKIAKANNIRNPDLIFAQTQIYIPER